MMKVWPIIIASFATASLTALAHTYQGQPQVTGTCASIGYSSTCCPPSEDCQAKDGNCRCSADCHHYGDCCQDNHCSQSNVANDLKLKCA